MAHLFVYGTLLPGEVRWHFLEPFVADGGREDSVGGRLFDTGLGYPAARFGADGVIHGRSFALTLERLAEALGVLDEVEGAVDGLYGRREIVTASGRAAWAYEGGAGLHLEPIHSGSWLQHRRA